MKIKTTVSDVESAKTFLKEVIKDLFEDEKQGVLVSEAIVGDDHLEER